MPVFQNTYRKLDRDTAYNKADNQSMYDCRNFRITSNDPSKNAALSVVRGNFPLVGNFITREYPNDYIIGSRQIRDRMIVFTTDDDSASPVASDGRIWSAPFGNDAVNMEDIILLYDGVLNLSKQHPIEDIVSFYENDDLIKVYWTDFYNNFRYANVAKYLTNSGLEYSTTNDYIDPDKFNIVQKLDLSTPSFVQMVNGNIPVGMVQYAYRLYKLNGPVSNFSPSGNLIPLTTSPLSLQSTLAFKGSDKLDSSGNLMSSGKGIQIKIENIDMDYDRIEVVAIHYNSLNDDPKIYIVEIKPTSPTVNITDEGNYTLGSYSLAEFTIINNPLKCKTIDTKNNILFAANIEQTEFNFDFDARAYRFMNNGSMVLTRLYDDDGSYWYNASNNPNLWIHYNSSNVSIGTVYGMTNLPVDIDAINNYNQVIKPTLIPFNIFQKNGSTVGGEGPNVKYSFEALSGYSTSQRIIDNLPVPYTFAGVSCALPYYYNSSESPKANQELRTWQRDEIYRVGMIGIDDRGRESPTKWIGDIRMPNNYASNFCSGVYGGMYSNPLQIKFEISNLPSTVKYVKIVYVKRTDTDKTIKFQGKISLVGIRQVGSSWEHFINNPKQSSVAYYGGLSGSEVNGYINRHIAIFSPDVSFYKNFNQGSNDFLEIIGTYNGNFDNPNASFESLKCHTLTAVLDKTIDVVSARIQDINPSPDNEVRQEVFGSLRYPFYPRVECDTTSYRYIGNLGTCVLIQLGAAINISGISGYMLANYRTNKFGVQYGGSTYEDRTRNEYISAGDIVSVTSGSCTSYAKNGDTFIAYTDQLTGYFNQFYYDFGSAVRNYNSVEMFPVESSVNLPYRVDDCYHRIYGQAPASYCLREKGNSEFKIGDTSYSYGWTDLYIENTVYKRVADAKKFYPAPLDYRPEKKNDTLVMASDMKEGLETFDAWTRWATNESINVDKKYGPVNKLVAWKNSLLYWQTNAVGVLGVLDRSVVADQQGHSTTLGQGTVLQRYDNIATNIGISTRFSLAISQNGVYWYDHKRKTINRFLNNIENLSTIKGVNSYLNSLNDDYSSIDNVISSNLGAKGFFMSYNPIYNEVWLTVKDSLNIGLSLIYNEVIDAYTGFVDTKGYWFMNFDNKIFSACGPYIYKEDKGYPGHFFGSYYDSYVTVVVNPVQNMVATYTNFEITSEVYETEFIQDSDPMGIPTLRTVDVTAVSETGARSGGIITHVGGTSIIAKGVCYGPSSNPTIDQNSHTHDGTGSSAYSSNIRGLLAARTYYLRAYATNGVGTGYGSEKTFTTITTCNIVTLAISSITETTAMSGWNLLEDGGESPISCGICWSTSSSPTISDNLVSELSVEGITTVQLTGLVHNTIYHVRAFATNSLGTVYGNEISFNTSFVYAPTVTTNLIYNITLEGCNTGGVIVNDGGKTITDKGICYSTSSGPTISNGKFSAGSGSSSFYTTMTGLSIGTLYYIRAYATNEIGTSYGEERTFTTNSLTVPQITHFGVSSIHQTDVYASGYLSNNGGSTITEEGFCYSINPTPTIGNTKYICSLGGLSGTIIGLSSGITYYIRAYAINSVGVGYSDEITFTTGSYNVPTVVSVSATKTGRTTADLVGNVTGDGGQPVTERGFYYGIDYESNIMNNHVVSDYGLGEFTKSLTGLIPGHTYYCFPYATNGIGRGSGSRMSFVTDSLSTPILTTNPITSITQTTCICGGNVISDNGSPVTSRGICLNTTPNPTSAYQLGGNGSGSFSITITGMTAGTTYYIRAFATNSQGTSYGEEYSFTTTAITPPVGITDYDGNIYHTVIIGTQEWIIENLKVTRFSDGVSIPLKADNTQFRDDVTGCFTCYNNNFANRPTYGYLYNWYAASSARNIAYLTGGGNPWRVPTSVDWVTLVAYLGGPLNAGGFLKEAGTVHWGSPNIGASNSTGFTGLPGGYKDSNNNVFVNMFQQGIYWSKTSDGTVCLLSYGTGSATIYSESKNKGFSIKLMRDV